MWMYFGAGCPLSVAMPGERWARERRRRRRPHSTKRAGAGRACDERRPAYLILGMHDKEMDFTVEESLYIFT